MKKLLLLTLFLVFGCLELGGTTCPVSQYLDQGVAVTYLDTDFKHILAGNQLTVTFDMTNLGEATAEGITAEIIGPDNFYILDSDSSQDFPGQALHPPDPERCLEGNAISSTITILSRSGKQTPESGTPIRLRLHYNYTSRSWADLVVMSKEEWDKSVQADQRPRGYQWSSAAPVKVKITVPDTPIVMDPEQSEQMVPINVRLEYSLGGEVKAVADPTTGNRQICAFRGWGGLGENIPNCVDRLSLKLQDGLAFVEHTKTFCGGVSGPGNCKFISNEDGEYTEVQLLPAKVSPDEKRAEDYVLWVKVTKPLDEIVQENLKIYADAYYQMETTYETDKVVIGHVG